MRSSRWKRLWKARLVIGQAQGLVMARHSVSSQAAFAILTKLSQHANAKLREIAAQIVAEAEPDEV